MITTTTTKTVTDTKLNKLINDHLSNLPKIGDVVKGKVIEAGKKSILIDIESFSTGIVRGREIKNLPPEFQDLQPGQNIEALVLDTENENGQMELSLKAAVIESAWQFIKDADQTQEIIDVKLIGANKGGLIAMIRNIPAFLPVSQLTQEHYPRVEGGDKKKILKKLRSYIGKTMSVKILSFSPEEEKIIISEKRAWEEAQKKILSSYNIGDTVKAVIKAITNFGAFVSFGNTLEGLVHISEIPQKDGEQKNIRELVNIGDEVDVKILDMRGNKVFLTMKLGSPKPETTSIEEETAEQPEKIEEETVSS